MLCLKEHTAWANQLLKRGKRRTIADIRRSIGDGQTLVYILETLGKVYFLSRNGHVLQEWSSLFITLKCTDVTLLHNKGNISFTIQSIDRASAIAIFGIELFDSQFLWCGSSVLGDEALQF